MSLTPASSAKSEPKLASRQASIYPTRRLGETSACEALDADVHLQTTATLRRWLETRALHGCILEWSACPDKLLKAPHPNPRLA